MERMEVVLKASVSEEGALAAKVPKLFSLAAVQGGPVKVKLEMTAAEAEGMKVSDAAKMARPVRKPVADLRFMIDSGVAWEGSRLQGLVVIQS